jgi:hypothetical protein
MEKYIKLIEDAKKFWNDVRQNGGRKVSDKGVTVWIDDNGDMVDSLYNPSDDTTSYVVHEDTEELIYED